MNNKLAELIDAYWDVAYQEGLDARSHDTPDGRAQKIRGLINVELKSYTRYKDALHQISLASQNSMSSQRECGIIARMALNPVSNKEPEWCWECNECGSQEYTSSVSEQDIEDYLACGGCGCNEFHRAIKGN